MIYKADNKAEKTKPNSLQSSCSHIGVVVNSLISHQLFFIPYNYNLQAYQKIGIMTLAYAVLLSKLIIPNMQSAKL